MKEVARDDKWAEQRDDNDRRRDEAAAEDANPLAPTQFADKLDQINESLLVLVSLTMRLYDLQLALLTHFNEDRANEIYELHENKGHANPPVYIPVMKDKDEK